MAETQKVHVAVRMGVKLDSPDALQKAFEKAKAVAEPVARIVGLLSDYDYLRKKAKAHGLLPAAYKLRGKVTSLKSGFDEVNAAKELEAAKSRGEFDAEQREGAERLYKIYGLYKEWKETCRNTMQVVKAG